MGREAPVTDALERPRAIRRPPAATSPTPDDLIDLDEVMAKTHLGASTIYKKMAAGEFPLAVKLSPRCVRWVLGEIDDYNRAARASRIVLRSPPPTPVAAASEAGEGAADPNSHRRRRGRPRTSASPACSG
jgi:prophage regulatory protein